MKQLYHIFLGFILLFVAVSCLDDPEGEAGIHNAKAPEVETLAEGIQVTATSVELSGKVVRENGRKVIERGFLYGNETPLSFGNGQKWVDEGEGKGDFSGIITELTPDTVYYLCAYAINDKGEGGRSCGEEIHVRTTTGLGVVRTLPVTDCRATSAVAHAKIENAGEGAIVARGFYLSYGAVNDSVVYSQDKETNYSYAFTNLKPNMTYRVKAFVKNQFGIVTGSVQQFKTTSGLPQLNPKLTLTASFTEATMMAGIVADGDSAVSSFGFRWGTMKEHVAEEGDTLTVQEKNPDGTFSGKLSGLISGQKYYVVAYATNAFGTSFTPDTFFITKSDEPVVTIRSCTLDEEKGCVVLKGHVESIGISEVKKVGFCYDTNFKPSIGKSKVVESKLSKENTFETILYLRGGYNYHFRAFATNSQTTGYSEESVLAIPSVFQTIRLDSKYNKMPGTVASFTYSNRCYLLGGDDPNGTSDELWAYNKYGRTLERTGTVFPKGGRKHQIVAGTAWGDAFVYGGYANGEAKRDFYAFTATSSKWTPYEIPKDGPDSLYLGTACLTQTGFVMIGGINKHETLTNEVWKFSAATWSKEASFPQAQSGGISVVIGNTLYAGMGETSSSGSDKCLWATSSQQIGPWTEVATMTGNNNAIRAGVVLDGVIYVVDTSGVIWSFNPSSESTTWTRRSKLPAEIANDVHTMFIMDETIHFGFGSTGMIVTYHPKWDN